MTRSAPSTSEHRGPAQPEAARRRPALVCAFPRPTALALPDSGATLGRAWLADQGLADTEVSGAHLRVDRAGGALRVADVGSRNGTWVNGHRLSPRDLTPLDEGAVVRIGRTLLVYRAELRGPLEPAAPLGGLVGPYGLRGVAETIAGLSAGGSAPQTPARPWPSNVLIEGDTGVGKELVARAVADALGRAAPFAAVNVAGVARGVFESQMFGHAAGAFSDARTSAPGIVVAHDGGTLFLDEIGELDLDLQVKLLRLLENREVLPVGAARPVRVDVLVLAATNRDLEGMVESGAFRRDLFARLAMGRVHVPPLAARCEDVFAVAQALAGRAGAPLAPEAVEVEALERLMLEPWPGNVRELDAALAAIRRVDPGSALRLWAVEDVLGGARAAKGALTEAAVEAALEVAGGNVSLAAERLGVSRGKLLRHRKRAQKA
jgi:MoxR-like ATPase